jgi:hypothetical protein
MPDHSEVDRIGLGMLPRDGNTARQAEQKIRVPPAEESKTANVT